jgi:hypothetical protein
LYKELPAQTQTNILGKTLVYKKKETHGLPPLKVYDDKRKLEVEKVVEVQPVVKDKDLVIGGKVLK